MLMTGLQGKLLSKAEHLLWDEGIVCWDGGSQKEGLGLSTTDADWQLREWQ